MLTTAPFRCYLWLLGCQLQLVLTSALAASTTELTFNMGPHQQVRPPPRPSSPILRSGVCWGSRRVHGVATDR